MTRLLLALSILMLFAAPPASAEGDAPAGDDHSRVAVLCDTAGSGSSQPELIAAPGADACPQGSRHAGFEIAVETVRDQPPPLPWPSVQPPEERKQP